MTSPDEKYADLASTRFRIHSVFKNFHSGKRIEKVAAACAEFTGCVWTEAVPGRKELWIQKYSYTCGLGLKLLAKNWGLTSACFLIILGADASQSWFINTCRKRK